MLPLLVLIFSNADSNPDVPYVADIRYGEA